MTADEQTSESGDTEKRPLRLGDARTWGETTCGFGLTIPECDRPATRHFMWLTDSHTSPACDEHAAYIHSRDTSATPFDEHAHGPDCGMPGALWRFPYEDQDEGYCFFPAVDDASLLAEEPVPVEMASDVASVPLLGCLPGHVQRSANGRPRNTRKTVVGDRALDGALDVRKIGAERREALRAVLDVPREAFPIASHPPVAKVVTRIARTHDLALAGARVGARALVVARDAIRVEVGAGDAVPGLHTSTILDATGKRQESLTVRYPPGQVTNHAS